MNQISKQSTPETDAEVERLFNSEYSKQEIIDQLDAFARTLERDRNAALAEIARLKEDHDSCCRLVAEMHAAAVGGVRGPVVGVVEDVSALKQAHSDTLARVAELEQAQIKLTNHIEKVERDNDELEKQHADTLAGEGKK